MNNIMDNVSLRLADRRDGADIYRLESDSLINRYFIVSTPGTRRLMASPEVVGFDAYSAMLQGTQAGISFIKSEFTSPVDILTILRGGLNYPLEECCFREGVQVNNMSFLSCERIRENGIIKGLDVKYDKLRVSKDTTLLIGDIVASCETLHRCLDIVMDRFVGEGGNLRRLVFFTIGGSKAIGHMEALAKRFRTLWPSFEGLDCFFYEGVFRVYEDHGSTGVNTPNIDFYWNGGAVAPEFRDYVLDYGDALFEQCTIYDGGARRYEIPVHCEEVVHYWNALKAVADKSDMKAFIEEKLGYKLGVSYGEWLKITHFENLPGDKTKALYDKEREFAQARLGWRMADICDRRLKEFNAIMCKYYK